MSFQTEYNELKRLLDTTIKNNPVLDRNQEFFIFTNINRLRNRIIQLYVKNDDIFSLFVKKIKQEVENGNAHEIFMVQSFSNAEDYEINLKHRIDSVESILVGDKKNAIDLLSKNNISHNVFHSIASEYHEKYNSTEILKVLNRDLEYCTKKIHLSNLKMLLRVLSIYTNTENLTVKDLFSEGSIGLNRAIELFNCNIGIKFSTYASQWIKAAINRSIADKELLIRIPVNVREQAKDAEKIKKRLISLTGKEPAAEDIIAEMKKKPTSLDELDVNFAYYQLESNTKEVQNDQGSAHSTGVSFEENLADTGIIDEVDNVTIKQLKEIIRDYVSELECDEERYYITYHFGINSQNLCKTKDEIMNDLAIQQNEYDRIRKRAISNMKKNLGKNNTLLDAYSIASGWESHSNLEF